jgi:hypothetical protein
MDFGSALLLAGPSPIELPRQNAFRLSSKQAGTILNENVVKWISMGALCVNDVGSIAGT